MNLEQKTREIATAMHKRNVVVMTPITLSAVAATLLYVTFIFQGLKPPDGAYHLHFLIKIVLCFVMLGGPNTYIFERWVRGQSLIAARAMAWDGNPATLSQKDLIESLLVLIDLPHRFIIRFLVHWVVGAPLIILLLRALFFDIPLTTVIFMSAGTVALMALMSTFHYFRIKDLYTGYLHEALKKFPNFFEKHELGTRRIKYGTKVWIYIVVLVGSMTFITTHLAFTGQVRSSALQRDAFITQTMAGQNAKYLAEEIKVRPESRDMLKAYLPAELGQNHERLYLITPEGKTLLKLVPAGNQDPGRDKIDREIMDLIPRSDQPPAGWLAWSFWKNALAAPFTKTYWKDEFFKRSVVVRITGRVLLAYAHGNQYNVTFAPIQTVERIAGGETAETVAYLYTIQPPARLTFQQVSQQMGPVSVMFILALIFSGLFAHFMQREIMAPLDLIIDSSRRIESGDLSEPDPIMADDELGELAIHHLRMVGSVRAMVKQIGDAARSIDQASVQIAARTEEMSQGSEAQSIGVEETSASITEMNQAINNIADSVDTLASSAEQSSASIIEMSATNDEVALNTESLSTAVEETTASVQEMSASIRQVAENVSEAAGKTSEAASSMREMRHTVKEVDKIAAESAVLSGQVTQNAEAGARAVGSTISGIRRIKETSRAAAEVIERLSKRARDIGRILTVIEDVTEETNLLALNAAIIAAQAGEHGRGFAVVADEIKDLAERTQASTAEIAEQITSVQREAREAVTVVEKGEASVEEGVHIAEEAGQALKMILESSARSREMAQTISDSTMEQSVKVDKVLAFFESIAGMIDQIKAATQEQTRGSEQVHEVAERMRDIAMQVRKATREQAQGGRQISQAIEHISHIANYINTSQTEQKKAAQHVLVSMTKIADIAHLNVTSVEKVSTAVTNLSVLADDLQAMLESFQMENGGPKNEAE